MTVPTPHIEAKAGDFAKTVLMPGDPLRAQFIAQTYLEHSVLVNNIRGIQGYTGFYQGTRISVMASGMGMPSIGIYAYELYQFYGVESIIRIGSAGAVSPQLQVRDIVAGIGACTNSDFARQYELPGTFAPTADYGLLCTADRIAREIGIELKVGTLFSSDTFYDDAESLEKWRKMGVLAVEMEAAALYMTAARAGKKALALCTISDCPFTGEACSAQERQTSFTQMMEIALQTQRQIRDDPALHFLCCSIIVLAYRNPTSAARFHCPRNHRPSHAPDRAYSEGADPYTDAQTAPPPASAPPAADNR